MADAQTIGGYPRIARLTSQAIDLLAQCRPGVKVRFTNNIFPDLLPNSA
jgi:allophanate hydrolase subunit 2